MSASDLNLKSEIPAAEPSAAPPMISGKWVILVVAGLGIFGSAFGWLWLYNAQRRPREYWGTGAWLAIGQSKRVDAVLLAPEQPAADGKPQPVWYDGLVVVPLNPRDAERYVVAERKPVENAPGFSLDKQSSSLREALAHHRSFQWDSKAAIVQRPVWRYALSFYQDRDVAPPAPAAPPTPTAVPAPESSSPATAVPEEPPFDAGPINVTILFDADCKFVRPQVVDKPMSLEPGIAEQFRRFFTTTFPSPRS